MFSVVTVTLDRLKPFLDIFLESIISSCKLIKEIVIVNVEKDKYYKEEYADNIKIKSIGGNQSLWKIDNPLAYCSQHAYGLHLGLEKTTQEYIMISDPDVFFYMPVDEYYLKLIGKYNLNMVGVSRPTATCHSIQFFPSVINFVMKKTDFPSVSFSENISPLNKMFNMSENLPSYFHPMSVDLLTEEIKSNFPIPNGHYETGCRLFLWAKNMRWLSFQTTDCNTYQTCFYRNNFKLKEKFIKEKLLYHESLSAGVQHNKIVPFTEAWRSKCTNTWL